VGCGGIRDAVRTQIVRYCSSQTRAPDGYQTMAIDGRMRLAPLSFSCCVEEDSMGEELPSGHFSSAGGGP
jgi:hypothetical protein